MSQKERTIESFSPAALIPLSDPMAAPDDDSILGKLDAYKRVGLLDLATVTDASATNHCAGLRAIYRPRLADDEPFLGSSSVALFQIGELACYIHSPARRIRATPHS
jgi:hypothetical protein